MQKQGLIAINKIIEKIEQYFNQFFKSPLIDEFDNEQIHQFKEALRASPQNYEQIIFQNLGFNKKYKQFVQNLKTNNEFLQLLKPLSIKAIHRLVLKQLKLGKNTNFIYYMELDPIMEWTLQNIIKENQKIQKQMFKENMKKSKSVEDFFLLIEDYFLDCCIRKLDISENILNINRISLQTSESLPQLREILKQITYSDFIRLFSHFYPNKQYFGQILHKISLPIPILFTTKSQYGLKQFNYPQMLNFIAREKNYCLITSFGTSKIAGKGKTTFLQKMFLLNKKNLSNSYSHFHQGSVDFYTKVPHKLKEKNILVADFHGDYLKQNEKYNSLLKLCLQVSSIIFIHLSERQATAQTQQNTLFLQRYNKQILPFIKDNAIALIRDCRQIDQQVFFEKNNGIDSIKLPNFTENQNLPTIQLRIDKIYKKMQDFSSQITISPSTFLSKEALIPHQKDKELVDRIMKFLIDKFKSNNILFYSHVFPNLSKQLKILDLKQKTIQYEIQIRRQGQIQDQRQILINYNKDKDELNKLLKNQPFPISQLVKQIVFLLHNKHHLMHLFAYQLSAWRTSQTSFFLDFIIAKTVHYNNIDKNKIQYSEERQQIKELIKTAQQTLQCYDISIDTFFSEIIAAMSHNKKKFQTNQAQIIRYYYQQAYKGIMPINLIQGKTLQFGNPFLEQFFESLSKQKYKNKQIFVVSVVGAQSSAKSTILNYIFRCNFATSVGRCTKGVYFTIVECQQKVIVVVDTQGLLSVAARDHTFDVQIACFVMLVSDLVIMNNKGEVNATLRDLLGVCIYAIDQLTSNQNEIYQPNKIIFTIRDQVQYGGSKQKQMLSMIIKSLNQNIEIKYSNYIDFTQEDIYPLQSAFTTQNFGNFCIEGANNSFGKSIMALRTRIMSMLKKPKNKTLTHFYLDSKRRWQAIQGCGQNIFNFKVLYTIRTKQDVKQIVENLKKQFYNLFISDQEHIISNYYQKELQNQNQIEHELKEYFTTFKKSILEQFNKRCQQKINQKQLYREFIFEVQQFCNFWHRDYLARFKKRLIQIRFQQQNSQFKIQIKSMLAQSISSKKSDIQIIQLLQNKKYNLKNTLIKQMQRVQSKQKSLGENQLTIEISRMVLIFLRKYYKKMNISYLNFQEIKEQYSEINKTKVMRDKMLLYWFKIKIVSQDQSKEAEVAKDKQQIIIHISNFINDCQRTVNSLIKFQLNADIQKIDDLMKKIMEQLLQDYQILMENLQRYFEKYNLQPFSPKQKGVILSRFISTFPKKFEKTYYQTSKNNLQIKITQQQKLLDQLTKQVKQSLTVKGNNKQIAKTWIKKIIQRQLDKYLNYNRILMQHRLSQLCSMINPKDLIKMALQPLSTSDIRSKQRWINCYKIVKNINRYLKQYLYNLPEIVQIDKRINDSKKQIYQKLQNYIKTYIKPQIQRVISKHINQDDNNIQKNINYYQKSFGIDLSAYKDIQTQNKLGQIIKYIQLITEALTDGPQYQYFQNYMIYDLDDKIRNTRKYFNSYIAQNIEPIIVGCNARCPGCGMKCYKTAGHVDGHALWQQNHVLECFNGKVYHQTNRRSSDLCFTQQNMHKDVFLPEENTTMTIQQWIKEKYPDWLDHYHDSRVYTKKKYRSKQLNTIWANIEYVVIKYKFKDMIPDKLTKQIQKMRVYQLEDEDIINLKLEDY